MPLLNVHKLSLTIGNERLLKDIDLTIDQGEIFGVVGESGSGKSMTALSIMNLLPSGAKRTGEVNFDDRNLCGLSEAVMCSLRGNDIGMIFQEPMTALNPLMTIGDQIAEPLIIHRGYSSSKARMVAAERLSRVDMPPSRFPLDLYPHELSGGQRQRVCIAMAVALQPKLLIADEPTTALDVSTQEQILKLLYELVIEDNMSMMLITHDLAVIANVANEICLMQKGKIVDAGQTQEIFRQRKHPYTRMLLSASQHAPAREAQKTNQPILTVSQAVRAYPQKRQKLFEIKQSKIAVDHVSFIINRGESVGLVGESGCGKSTLTRTILGLDPLEKGMIEIDGVAVRSDTKMPHALRRKIQVVFQDPYGSFNPRHKVRRLISEPFHLVDPSPSAQDKEELLIASLLDVGLEAQDLEKYINEFSGGQRQRIAIARALVLRPDIIILDEAVSALDVSIRSQILDLLVSLQEKHNLTYLFISHDLNVVRSITDRVLVMENGKIVEEGETESIFNSPSHSYTAKLLQATPTIPSQWLV